MGDIKISAPNTGERPFFFADPAIDQLLGMMLAMSAELAVTYDRLDTMERLLESNGLLKRADIEDYRPGVQVATERKQHHQEYLHRILRIIREERQRLTPFDQMKEYEGLLEELRQD